MLRMIFGNLAIFRKGLTIQLLSFTYLNKSSESSVIIPIFWNQLLVKCLN